MRKTNLLYVITKLELGGAQKQLLSLARHLDKNKFNVFIFTARRGPLIQQAAAIPHVTLKTSSVLERTINPLRDILALFEIYAFIRKNSIDLVHTHSSKAGILGRLAGRLAGTKMILHTVHGWSFHDCQHPLTRRLFIWLERLAAKISHKIIVVSEHDKVKGVINGIGKENQYALIRYGINYADFSRRNGAIRKEFAIQNDDLVVTNVSCFKPQKACLDFVRLAFLVNRIFPAAKFILAGDGRMRGKIEKAINRFRLRDKFILTGWRQDIPEILSATDVFILTSLWEGLPIAALEALASSRPVIATDTGGIREVIKEGDNGFLISVKDMRAMKDKLMLLLQDKTLREAMGEKGLSHLGSDFTQEKMVNRSQELYEGLISCREN
jgi:glycosyltransferase involved in cell wall biosynthesis